MERRFHRLLFAFRREGYRREVNLYFAFWLSQIHTDVQDARERNERLLTEIVFLSCLAGFRVWVWKHEGRVFEG